MSNMPTKHSRDGFDGFLWIIVLLIAPAVLGLWWVYGLYLFLLISAGLLR